MNRTKASIYLFLSALSLAIRRTVVDFLRTMSGDEAATLAGSLPTFSIPAVKNGYPDG